jgi:hypothetical protein
LDAGVVVIEAIGGDNIAEPHLPRDRHRRHTAPLELLCRPAVGVALARSLNSLERQGWGSPPCPHTSTTSSVPWLKLAGTRAVLTANHSLDQCFASCEAGARRALRSWRRPFHSWFSRGQPRTQANGCREQPGTENRNGWPPLRWLGLVVMYPECRTTTRPAIVHDRLRVPARIGDVPLERRRRSFTTARRLRRAPATRHRRELSRSSKSAWQRRRWKVLASRHRRVARLRCARGASNNSFGTLAVPLPCPQACPQVCGRCVLGPPLAARAPLARAACLRCAPEKGPPHARP